MTERKSIYTVLTDKVVGLSISGSEDLARFGLGEAHLIDAKIEIARHLLACGSVLMYGGDLREDGYTRNLFDLVESYVPSGVVDERLSLINYLGWPNHIRLTDSLKARLSSSVRFIESGLPEDIKDNLRPSAYLNPTKSVHYYYWMRSMTRMRMEMISANDARIALGGATMGYKGKYPGIVEEVVLSLRMRKPVFLIGAFGGVTLDLIEGLKGKRPHRLTTEYQCGNMEVKRNIEYYNRKISEVDNDVIDFEKLLNELNGIGIEGLNNGLSIDDNRRLFTTIHIPEMISLILKGLVSKFGDWPSE